MCYNSKWVYSLICLSLCLGWTACATKNSSTESVTFFVIGDPQINVSRWGIEGTKQTIQWMNELPGKPFPFGGHVSEPLGVLVLGDLVDDVHDPANWKTYTSLFDPRGQALLHFAAYECIGNHDLDAQQKPPGFSSVQKEMIQRNQQRPGPVRLDPNNYHYSWDWGPLHMVCLNLFPGTESRPVYDRPVAWNDPHGSLDFLRKDLAAQVADSGQPVILMWHYGLVGWGLEKWWTPEDLTNLKEVLQPYNVVLILHGHEHAYRRYQWAGYDVCMAPSPQVDRNPDDPQSVSKPKGFLMVRLKADQLQVAHFTDGLWRDTWSKKITFAQTAASTSRSRF